MSSSTLTTAAFSLLRSISGKLTVEIPFMFSYRAVNSSYSCVNYDKGSTFTVLPLTNEIGPSLGRPFSAYSLISALKNIVRLGPVAFKSSEQTLPIGYNCSKEFTILIGISPGSLITPS